MKILLTGSNGLVGKNILDNLKSKQYDFLAPSSSELNLLNHQKVNKYLKNNKPDLIIHAAGLVGGIEANIKNPTEFLLSNTNIGLNLINSALENNITNFLNLGSSCIYPKDAKNPLKEDSILNGKLEPTNEGYALAKIVTLKLCEYISLTESNKLYKTVIPCNLYGKFDNFDPKSSHMIPAVIRKIYKAHINKEDSIEIWGDGKSRREFMPASSFADFIFYAIENFIKMPQNLNVGLGFDFSILDYYKEIASVIGYKGNFVHDMSKPTGMKQKLVDIQKLSKFGWENKISLKDGLTEAYDFYKGSIDEI